MCEQPKKDLDAHEKLYPGQKVCRQHTQCAQSGGSKDPPIISGITLFLLHQYPGIPIEQVNDAWEYMQFLTSLSLGIRKLLRISEMM